MIIPVAIYQIMVGILIFLSNKFNTVDVKIATKIISSISDKIVK